jgi:hypothetical protein
MAASSMTTLKFHGIRSVHTVDQFILALEILKIVKAHKVKRVSIGYEAPVFISPYSEEIIVDLYGDLS